MEHLHGGCVHEASRKFNRARETFVDFSSNMNIFAPRVPEADWARWKNEIEVYPELQTSDLAARLSDVYKTERKFLLPTAGAIEGIYCCAQLFQKAKVAISEPAFGDYYRAFNAVGARVERIAFEPQEWNNFPGVLREKFSDFEVVIFGNPNNPTGTFIPKKQLINDLLKFTTPGQAVIVDEAFIEFTAKGEQESLLSVLSSQPNLIVIRSLTKSWRIPGLRLGFVATSNIAWLKRIESIQPPWSINSITMAWAEEYLNCGHYEQVLMSLVDLPRLRTEFQARLATIPEIAVLPGAANFFLIELKMRSPGSSKIFDLLAEAGFLVRVCDSFFGMQKERFLRVAVRTEYENKRFADALEQVYSMNVPMLHSNP